MTQTGYSITFDCRDHFGWEEFWCDIDDTDSYNEMINDIKYAARKYGGGIVYIYDGDGELVETWTISKRPVAIYHVDDKVSFIFDEKEYIGTIAIVDTFGTFFDNSEPYYDIYIMLEDQKILVKHVRQSAIRRL